jgi:hypothetical protein
MKLHFADAGTTLALRIDQHRKVAMRGVYHVL